MVVTAAIGVLVAVIAMLSPVPVAHGQTDVGLKILGEPPLTWDPARAGDTASAAVLAQVFEGLTALDPDNKVEPALAEKWSVSDDGRHIDFTLRSGIKYSDGTPIGAQDVVDSWFRVIDPARPSPLVSLLNDVDGVPEYLSRSAGKDAVGLHAQTNHVVVDLSRPATYFVAATTSPSLAVVPPSMFGAFPTDDSVPANLVVSGAYRPTAETDASLNLQANANYWAGTPILAAVDVVTDTAGKSPIDMFEAGDLDYTPVGPYDAAWLKFDPDLGPQLRQTSSMEVQYYGFDARTAPFNDPLVRQAFAKAVDWDRIVTLAGGNPTHSIVPPGLATGDGDNRPSYDPAAARELLSRAGFAGGAGFPAIALVSNGFGYEPAVAAELNQQLGIKVTVEVLEFSDLQQRQQAGVHDKFWNQIWSADYPHPNDFLGLLLGSGSTSNEGGWSNPDFDREITAAAAATDATEQAQHYGAAQAIVKDQAPALPVEAPQTWALSRNGLLGALPSGSGFLRYAGMAWSAGQ